MGTLIYSKGVPTRVSYDELNLSSPGLIRSIHRDYLLAGAEFLETNTFGANRLHLKDYGCESETAAINYQGAKLAREVAGAKAWVGGSVGPIRNKNREERTLTPEEKADVFAEQMIALADGGVDAIVLETFSDMDELLVGLRVAREKTGLPVVCQMTFDEKGGSLRGVKVEDMATALPAAGAAVVGVNCGSGPAGVLAVVRRLAVAADPAVPLSAFPNAGYPEQVDGRHFYLANPAYIAERAGEIVRQGVSLIGGCCGTTPADIAAISAATKDLVPVVRVRSAGIPAEPALEKASAPAPPGGRSPSFLDALPRRKVILCEIDPPKTLEWERMVQRAREAKRAGADAITIADNPLAMLRMSNVAMAIHMREGAGVETLLHLSCRDKNLIGMQSELMGLSSLGFHNVLALTGDPAAVGGQLGATSVFDLHSFTLISLIAGMNKGATLSGSPLKRPTSFNIGCAFNPNTKSMRTQAKRLEKKAALGATYALTQPVYDAARVRAMVAETAPIPVSVFLGIFPLLSLRNAEYLHNEVPGIQIPDEVRARMAAAGENGAAEGLRIAKEVIEASFDLVPGFYVIPPLAKFDVALELIDFIKGLASARER